MMSYGWRQETTCRTLQKGKDYGPGYLKLGMFSSMPKIVMSRARVGFMFGLQGINIGSRLL